MQHVRNTPSNYRPEIDGLRALAVVPVVLYHAHIGSPGGFVGVDVFFVISGYLITSLLAKDLEDGRIDLLAFWERRIRRILPALIVVTLATLAAGWFLLLPIDYAELAQSAFFQTLLCSNFFFWTHTNYFDGAADLKPLLHTWSLSVEEQSYLLYPFAIILLTKVRRQFAFVAVGVLFFLGLALSIYGVSHHPRATFYLLPFRAWELAVGAILVAVRQRTLGFWFNEALSTMGIASILYAVFSYNNSVSVPGIAALPPCVGAAFFIHSNSAKLTLTGKILSWRPFVFIGLISYSLYLWHWPVLVFANYWALRPLPLSVRVFLVAVSFLLAAVSLRFVETPFRKSSPDRKRVLLVASTAVCGLLLLSFSIQKLDGVSSRLPHETLRYADARFDFNPVFHSEVTLQDAEAGRFLLFGSKRLDDSLNLFVWGDSHAMAVLPALDDLSKLHAIRACAATHSETPPLLDYVPTGPYSLGNEAPAFGQSVLEFVRSNHIPNVVLAARWKGYDAGQSPVFHAAFGETITALRKAGAKIWVMEEVPNFPWDVPKALARAALFGEAREKVSLPLLEYLRQLASQLREFSPVVGARVVLLSPLGYLSNDLAVPSCSEDGMALYSDVHHLSIHGCRLLRPMFAPIFSP